MSHRIDPTRSRPSALALALLAIFGCSMLLAACGGDSDSTGETATTATDTASTDSGDALDPEAAAQSLADCTTQAGLEGSVSDTTQPGAVAVDLTTENATILVHVYASEDEAESADSSSGLDQEVVGNYVILGGAIPKKDHDIITGCIGGS